MSPVKRCLFMVSIFRQRISYINKKECKAFRNSKGQILKQLLHGVYSYGYFQCSQQDSPCVHEDYMHE